MLAELRSRKFFVTKSARSHDKKGGMGKLVISSVAQSVCFVDVRLEVIQDDLIIVVRMLMLGVIEFGCYQSVSV